MYKICSVGVSFLGRLNPNDFDTLYPARTGFSNELAGSYTFDNFIGGKTAFISHSDQFSFFHIFPTLIPPFLDIDKPDDYTGSKANREEERKAHPIVVRVVDYGLNHVGTDDAGLYQISGRIREAKLT